MRSKCYILFIVFIVLYNPAFTQQNPDAIESAIQKSEKIINKLLRKAIIPGMAVTVIKDDAVIWQKGYGFADVEKQTPAHPENTLFRIASVSKPLAATGLAKMVADSIMDLEASLYTYVPYFPKKAHDISIKQLGSHTSGIRGYRGKEFMSNIPRTIKEGVSMFKDDPLQFSPGSGYLYSSFNWNLLALAMQEAAGMPFDAYIKEQILEPLQMLHTLPDTQDSIPGKAVFYTRSRKTKFRPAFPVHNAYKLASGGYLSTTADIAKLGNAYLQHHFIPENIASRFITAQEVNGASTWYGIGWEISFDSNNRPFYGHTGNGIGGYAFFRIYPAQHLVFSILVNVTHPGIEEELQTIADHILNATVRKRK